MCNNDDNNQKKCALRERTRVNADDEETEVEFLTHDEEIK